MSRDVLTLGQGSQTRYSKVQIWFIDKVNGPKQMLISKPLLLKLFTTYNQKKWRAAV